MKTTRKLMAGLVTGVLLVLIPMSIAAAAPLQYEMYNGGGMGVLYHDETYLGGSPPGNENLDYAPLWGGEGQITNIAIGTYDPSDVAWVGWGYWDPFVTIDLGAIVQVKQVSIHTLVNSSAAIACYAQVKLWFSDDKVNWNASETYLTTPADKAEGAHWVNTQQFSHAARYVRADFTRVGTWTFVSEIKPDSVAIPEPGSLLALATGLIGAFGLVRRRR